MIPAITPANHKHSCCMHAGVGGAGCGVHYFEFAEKWFSSGLLYIELTFQIASSWSEVRATAMPLLKI